MKLTNAEIWQLAGVRGEIAKKTPLQKILELPADKLTWRGKYFLVKLARIIGGPIQDLEAIRVKLVQQHGEKTPVGYEVLPGEAFGAFQAQFMEVLGLEIELDWASVILAEKDAEALTGEQILLLEKFIAFPVPSPVAPNGAVKEPLELVK